MAKFVGAEYFVANVLIEEKRKGKDQVSFDDLGICGNLVQKKFIEADMDVIFLTSKSQYMDIIFDFPDYFEYTTSQQGQIQGIALKKNKGISDLQYRFEYYLPIEISSLLQKIIRDFVELGKSDIYETN